METKDPDAASDASAAPTESERLAPLRWPPPGLSRLQGDAYGATRWMAAGAFLILPLLWAVVAEQDPWSLGPLGSVLWLAFLLGIVGLPVLLGGYIVLARLLRRASDAVGQGHHLRVVALVATDHRRDTGFLLQGARAYRLLGDGARRRLATVRIVVGGLLLFAALWLTLGFGISIVLAARGVLGPWGVAATTLGPAALAGSVAVLGYAWEEGVLRKCRKRWYSQDWSQQLARDEIRDWQKAMAERTPGFPGPESVPEGGGRTRTALRASYVGLSVATLVAFVPVFTLIFSAAIIPVVARISVPAFERTVTRAAGVEPMRAYMLPRDSSISAREAGELLHSLSFVGRPYRATEGVLPPEDRYEEPWFPGSGTMDVPVSQRMQSVVTGMGARLSPDDRPYLRSVADHAAHEDFARLARAPALDIAGVRWSIPLPSDVTMAELSMPAMGSVRQAGYAHLARAAVQADRGQAARADTTIREVLSVGLLMADESPMVLDNLMGLVLVDVAGDALEALYENTGHQDARALAWGREAVRRSVERTQAAAVRDVAARLRAMPDNTLDPAFVRGVRWEYVGLLNTLGPCLNLRRVVFGPSADYQSWLERAEAQLVRYPAEAELFEIARGGLLGRDPDRPASLSTRVLALTMGDADQPGSCARVLGEVVGF